MTGGSIQAGPVMYLALSYDHRIIDGREAVSFLVRVKEYIGSPERCCWMRKLSYDSRKLDAVERR